MDGILRFSCQLQMQPCTNFVPASHLTPSIKPPLPSMHAHPKPFLSTTFWKQQILPLYTKRALKKMMQRLLSPTLLLLILFLLCTTTYGQSLAPAAAPSGATTTSGQSSPPTSSPSGPTDINAILGKAGKFTTFIGLLKSTQMDSQINSELQKKSNPGFTIFAPTDSAFSELKTGTLNSYTDEQKAALTKFHVLHSFLTISQFQTVSNPLHTEAAANTEEFPLNVIGNGTQVNITTGLVNTTVDSTVYSDGQLAVYETPQVLLAQGILRPQAPAPAPLPPKPKKATPLNSQAPSTSTTVSVDSSGATGTLQYYAPLVVSIGVAVAAALPYAYELKG